MKILIVGLCTSVLLLTGCSSGQSLENEIQLIEYQACLESNSNLNLSLAESNKDVKIFDFSKSILNCDFYKPKP
jgi:hypothetical protein